MVASKSSATIEYSVEPWRIEFRKSTLCEVLISVETTAGDS